MAGNEKLKGEKIGFKNIVINKSALISFLPNSLDVTNGVIIEGDFPSLKGNEKSTLYIQCENNHGTAIFLKSNGQVEFGEPVENSKEFIINDTINREMKFSAQPHFKLFLKQSLIEFYIDDVLIQCYTLPAKSTGKIGIVSRFKQIKNFTGWNVKRKNQ
ncbi:MAG: hypothetical protein WKG06_10015 [Segetibacter sp.]